MIFLFLTQILTLAALETRGALPYWVILGMCGQNGWVFQAKNLRMCHNFDIILPGNGWFSSKLNKKPIVVWSISVVSSLRVGVFSSIDGSALVCGWVNVSILWPHTPVQTKVKCPPGLEIEIVFFTPLGFPRVTPSGDTMDILTFCA